jgi:hypothetical protein
MVPPGFQAKKNLPLSNSLLTTSTTFTFPHMSITHWTEVFSETLTEHVHQYIWACGDPAGREKVISSCVDEITKSPLCDEQVTKLPENLTSVSISFCKA